MPRLSTNGRADNLHGIVVFLRLVDAGSLSRAARSFGGSIRASSQGAAVFAEDPCVRRSAALDQAPAAGRGQEDVRRIRRKSLRAAA
jgi:hypothetical protein